MKSIRLIQVVSALTLLSGLSVSPQVLATPNNFLLFTSDNKVIATGKFDEMPDSIAKVTVAMQGQEYSGTGVITNSLARATKAMRSDRAMMATKHKKHMVAELVAANDAKLACELNMQFGDIWGQCVNPVNQQIFSLKTSAEEAK